jgi:hypothetical protein
LSVAALRSDEEELGDAHEKQFSLCLRDTHERNLSNPASTLGEWITCLDYLVGLQDTHFEEMELTYKSEHEL